VGRIRGLGGLEEKEIGVSEGKRVIKLGEGI
jgi:hypothetical protein